ncbi:MAG: hypothetical protein ABF858_03820 [Lacticaseibacillus paracasei]
MSDNLVLGTATPHVENYSDTVNGMYSTVGSLAGLKVTIALDFTSNTTGKAWHISVGGFQLIDESTDNSTTHFENTVTIDSTSDTSINWAIDDKKGSGKTGFTVANLIIVAWDDPNTPPDTTWRPAASETTTTTTTKPTTTTTSTTTKPTTTTSTTTKPTTTTTTTKPTTTTTSTTTKPTTTTSTTTKPTTTTTTTTFPPNKTPCVVPYVGSVPCNQLEQGFIVQFTATGSASSLSFKIDDTELTSSNAVAAGDVFLLNGFSYTQNGLSIVSKTNKAYFVLQPDKPNRITCNVPGTVRILGFQNLYA